MKETITGDAAHCVAVQFRLPGEINGITPYGSGLINDTYLVELAGISTDKVILQRVNTGVFPRPRSIMANYRVILRHVQRIKRTQGLASPLYLPEIIRSKEAKDFVMDARFGFWRALTFIDHAVSLKSVQSHAQAEQVGKILGRFHSCLSDLDPSNLSDTLPGFHVAPKYLRRFDRVLESAGVTQEKEETRYCCRFIEERRRQIPVLERLKAQGKLVLRVMHGDPKLDNILFDEQDGTAVSLIDLDTVKPGLIHYDVGDCLRSVCNLAGESPSDDDDVRFDFARCQAVLTGYLSEARHFFTVHDYHSLYDAIRLIPLELGLRFFIDYLEGNKYFKVTDAEHNLRRAKTQFLLTESIERQERDIKHLIEALKG